MTKNDLKVGYVVVRRNGDVRMVMRASDDMVCASANQKFSQFENMNDDLTSCFGCEFDIVEVYGFSTNPTRTLIVETQNRPLLWERKEETTEEKPTPIDLEINEFSQLVHANAVKHGWWSEERAFGEIVALCHSELSEALEEYRNDKPMFYWIDEHGNIETDINNYNGQKLEGIATEMIDCIIRILDWCGKEHIDVEKVLRMKHRYNEGRPYKHGGKKI